MKLSERTVAELVDTLRYIEREFDRGFRIDAQNIEHVRKALALVDVEAGFERQRSFAERYAASLPQAAE